jgi:hypothetical protein
MDAPRISDSIRGWEHTEFGDGLFEGEGPWVCAATRKTERIVNSFTLLTGD